MSAVRYAVMVLLVHCAGCAERHEAAPLPIQPLGLDARPGSALPNLVADDRGRVYLSWVEPSGGGAHAMKFSVLGQNGWGSPRTIAYGADWFVNWADFPSMAALRDGTLAAHWLRKSGPATYAYDVQIAFSPDQGTTWSEAVVPHTDATATEHGFVSLAPWGEDRLFAVWLDGRHFQGLKEEAERHAAMTLRYGILRTNGALEEEGEIDARTCSCCQTAAAALREEVLVAYRDRSEAEIRDVSTQRYAGGGWSGPASIREDGWRIDACPVNGPSIDAFNEQVGIAWYTGARDEPRVYLRFSGNGGRDYGPEIRVDDGRPIGRVDVELMPDGSGLVLWMEQAKAGSEIRLRRVLPDGRSAGHWTVTATSGDRASGFPRMVLIADLLVLAWTDVDSKGNKSVKTARVPVASLQAAP